MDDNRKFFSVKQVVEYIGKGAISSFGIYQGIKDGTIPAKCIGRKKLIPAQWVYDFCNQDSK